VLLAGEEVRPRKHWPAWLVQRLFTTVQLEPLTRGDVAPYLAHRLTVAAVADERESESPPGRDARAPADAFSPDAAKLIGDWSEGVPRLINRAAHLALHVAYLDLAQRVGVDHVRRAIARVVPGNAEPAGVIS